ncbi:glycosyl transferase, partial [Brachyspira hyodysenteriae]|uniref:ATP-grasp fold amidoligase family protein n=1 Tax=Brachyspira hyodysenteriae TaxID=159 RepID=UPI00063DA1DA
IVKDKSKLDIEEVKNKLEYWMKPTSNHYYYSYEWCYKNIKPKIICEKYINENKINEAFVYRMFFFNGVLNYINLDIPFHNTIKNNVKFKSLHFNDKWEKLNIKTRDEIYQSDIDKPYNLENIINIAKTISKPFIFVRVDLFNIRENILFGELTFYPNNGLAQFDPTEWDYKFGELLELPKEKKLEYNYMDRDGLIEQVTNLEPIVKQYRDLEEDYNKLKPLEEKIKFYSKKFHLFTIFNIDILSFTSNK